MKKLKLIAVFSLFLLSTILTGCGGGGGGGGGGDGAATETTQSPNGLWTEVGDPNSFGIITESNDLFFINFTDNTLITGRVTSSRGSTSTGDLRAYAFIGTEFANGNTIVDGTFSLDVQERSSFTGTINSVLDTDPFTFTYDPLYERNSSLGLTSGIWVGIDAFGDTVTLVIAGDGIFTGSDTFGCSYSGLVRLINSNFIAYNFSITASLCGMVNGTYSGVAIVSDNIFTNDTLILGVSNPELAFVLSLTRQ